MDGLAKRDIQTVMRVLQGEGRSIPKPISE